MVQISVEKKAKWNYNGNMNKQTGQKSAGGLWFDESQVR